MSSLPAEVDFTANPAATSARMDQAMAFLVAWLRRVESVQPEFLAVTEQLKAVGLSRLDEVLSPIFLDAQGISAQLAAIRTAWLTGQPLTQLLAELTAQVTGRLTTVDGKLADVDARLAANLASVTSQLGNNNAAVTAQLAANATSVGNQLTAQSASVDGKLAELSPTAKWAAATADEARAATASRLISAAILWAMRAPVALTDAPTIAVDLSLGINFTVTIAGNRVLGNPTNGKSGQTGSIFVTQDATGGRVLSFGANYVPDDLATFPLLNTAAGAVTELRYKVAPDGKVRLYGGRPSPSKRVQTISIASTGIFHTYRPTKAETVQVTFQDYNQGGNLSWGRSNIAGASYENQPPLSNGQTVTITLTAAQVLQFSANTSGSYVQVVEQ